MLACETGSKRTHLTSRQPDNCDAPHPHVYVACMMFLRVSEVGIWKIFFSVRMNTSQMGLGTGVQMQRRRLLDKALLFLHGLSPLILIALNSVKSSDEVHMAPNICWSGQLYRHRRASIVRQFVFANRQNHCFQLKKLQSSMGTSGGVGPQRAVSRSRVFNLRLYTTP